MVAAAIIRLTERLQIRGGPTALRLLAAIGLGRESTSTIELPSGRLIHFPAIDHYWARFLWGGATYEPDVKWIFDCLGPIPGKLLIDAGANIGYWTVAMSSPGYGFTDFVAIEANARMVAFARENVRLNGIPGTVVHAALSDQSGNIVRLGNTYHHAIASVGDEGVPVPTVTLADLLADYELENRLTVVKLDIEGSEIAAIRGASSVGEWHPVYIYEDWPSNGMHVTEHLLHAGFTVIGVVPGVEPRLLRSAVEACEFNMQTARRKAPSNLVGCYPQELKTLMTCLQSASGR